MWEHAIGEETKEKFVRQEQLGYLSTAKHPFKKKETYRHADVRAILLRFLQILVKHHKLVYPEGYKDCTQKVHFLTIQKSRVGWEESHRFGLLQNTI